MEPGRPIVTKTDLAGRITYANPAFVAISGFSRDELIGQNHNIVRHPDMPAEAFADLWRTIQAGRPWRGIVKNRAKNGDFYWVEAYVTPLTENGQRVGYMSVRTPPSTEARERAEALYGRLRTGSATLPPTRLSHGSSLSVTTGAGLALTLLFGAAAAFFDGLPAALLVGAQAVVAAGLWLLLQRRVQVPLHTLLGLLADIGEGRLKGEPPQEGCSEMQTLGSAVMSMQVSLRALIGDVVASANDTAREAARLHTSAQRLQRGSHSQADQLASSASAMEELAVSVSEIAGATDNSADQARTAQSITADGQRNMSNAAESTHRVVAAVEENNRMLEALSDSVEKIGVVAAAISEIAKRTNLLALNAAIEAARAGEQGRGFAVVAGEVTELAGQTQHSTEDIARLIAEISERKTSVIQTMQTLREGVSGSVNTIRTVAEELEQISSANTAVANNSEEIRHMLRQQEQASAEVANIMERMSGLTEDNLQTVTDVEEAAAALETTARELQLLVAHFETRL
ncbi:methyl-accepting chemotaxis protein [Azoarcus olearius]|uniref:Probable aerotaxis receptor n=1 Tax=Azoarcus sp. (strain BH72) TaxID=418699 RepID=A1K7L1_AZOSB|nr:methyl-accepting chemotaxis protein [Azoarcus olearius]ANQ85363.1 aerotaxis receptor [Azoarcus olearius]CAL94816.1 probable aerotaxis receptor [Azoarcus olearius]